MLHVNKNTQLSVNIFLAPDLNGEKLTPALVEDTKNGTENVSKTA